MDHVHHSFDRYEGLIPALAKLAEAQHAQACATVYAAAYTANLAQSAVGANSKAGEAVHHFMKSIK